ncbi:exonuclease domain-containing protein [Burkholderia ambifaria]|uniref:3'-5' exonuclease n=1 Tax=Burkholderia ambifaria TaxID=152480 RepID=UPI001E422386|nr:3'-5' exonuclease [Burkholderia ambifaria]UEP20723.1 exonuclease domain-containing protein [Burkholderia ambifaria]
MNILVVDLEATCSDDGTIAPEKMETIEIGACWVGVDGSVLDRFQSFVRPIVNPRLTEFCSRLTGIRQADVDSAPLFPTAAELLREFVHRHQTPGSTWASWGAYDHRQLTRDSARHGIAEPIEMRHQNAKRLFAKSQRIGKEVGMAKACELAGLTPEGTHHRGLDDALNVARLLPWAFGDRLLRSREHATP